MSPRSDSGAANGAAAGADSEEHQPLTILFDLDGTLAATAPDIANAVNMMLSERGWPTISPEAAYDFIGTGAAAEELVRLSLNGKIPPGHDMAALLARYFEFYCDNLCVQTTLFEGCEACLETLADEGHILAVCTNKPTRLARSLLEALGVDRYFSAICGRDYFPYHKPDPRHLTATIAAAGGQGRPALLIGDSITDCSAARAAGLPVILVSFGYSSVPVATLQGDAIVDHYRDLPMSIRRLAAAL